MRRALRPIHRVVPSEAAVPDAMTGDGGPYVGTAQAANLRQRRLLARGWRVCVPEPRSGGGRTIQSSFAEQVAPPKRSLLQQRRSRTRRSSRSTSTATSSIRRPERMPAVALLAIPVADLTRPSRIKAFWTDPYGVASTPIRFNPRDYPSDRLMCG